VNGFARRRFRTFDRLLDVIALIGRRSGGWG